MTKIKEYKFKQPPSLLLPAAAIVATMATASVIKDHWDHPDTDGLVSDLSVNEMFCAAPQFEQKMDMFDDPFQRLTQEQGQAASYTQFWHDGTEHKIVAFEFDYNKSSTSRHLEFFNAIPRDVIDDPSVTFILTGHASYDLDDRLGLRAGVAPPDDFERQHYQHLKNNFAVASNRVDFIKGKLLEAGVPESRIATNNLNTRFDKRAVDLEVCMPHHQALEQE